MDNYNVGVVIYVNFPTNFDKLMQVKNEIERALIAKYGEEAVTVTRIKESKEYENYSLRILVNVPEKTGMHIELKETKDNDSETH